MSQQGPTSYQRLLFHLTASTGAPAFAMGGRTLTYGELDFWSSAFATQLAGMGVGPGERVAVYAGTSIPLIIAWIGVYKAGAIYVPMNTQYRAREVAHVLEDATPAVVVHEPEGEARGVIADGCALAGVAPIRVALGEPEGEVVAEGVELDFGELLREAPRGVPEAAHDDEDIALIIYTSGTTGRSKGVKLSYRAVVHGIMNLTTLWEWSHNDVQSLSLPLFHVHGLGIGLHGALLHGVPTRLHRKFEPSRVVGDFRYHGATIFMGVPTMYARLLEHLSEYPDDGEELAGGRLFTSGSAALPEQDFRAFWRMTGHRIVERYGMTETMLTLSNPYRGQRKPGSVGHPIPWVEARIVDSEGAAVADGETGELQVRGVSLFSGYWGVERSVVDDEGWFATGDVARQDADGYYELLGRKSVDILKSGGYKISAREIEEVLLAHGRVREVAVVGLPDATWGQRVVAVVVASGPVSAEELDTHCAAHLANYKRPRAFELVDELPRNALGKVQKHRLITSLS